MRAIPHKWQNFLSENGHSHISSSDLSQPGGIPGAIHPDILTATLQAGKELARLGIYHHEEKNLPDDHHPIPRVRLFHGSRHAASLSRQPPRAWAVRYDSRLRLVRKPPPLGTTATFAYTLAHLGFLQVSAGHHILIL